MEAGSSLTLVLPPQPLQAIEVAADAPHGFRIEQKTSQA
jgi:hypothetical protein